MTALQQILMSAVGGGIQFVGYATRVMNESTPISTLSLTSLTGGIGSSAQSGDFVVAVYNLTGTTDAALTITDGTTAYTLIATELYANSSSVDINLRVAYKFITGDTTVSFSATNAAQSGIAAVYVFRGVNVATPLDVAATTATATNTTLANPPAITPITTGAYVMCIGAGGRTTTPFAYASSSLTGFFFTQQNTTATFSFPLIGIGHIAWTSGTFDCAAFTLSSGTDAAGSAYAAMSIALRPA